MYIHICIYIYMRDVNAGVCVWIRIVYLYTYIHTYDGRLPYEETIAQEQGHGMLIAPVENAAFEGLRRYS